MRKTCVGQAEFKWRLVLPLAPHSGTSSSPPTIICQHPLHLFKATSRPSCFSSFPFHHSIDCLLCTPLVPPIPCQPQNVLSRPLTGRQALGDQVRPCNSFPAAASYARTARLHRKPRQFGRRIEAQQTGDQKIRQGLRAAAEDRGLLCSPSTCCYLSCHSIRITGQCRPSFVADRWERR